MERALTALDGVVLRHPAEADYPALRRNVKSWWGERSRGVMPRLWLRHFGSTSWVAEADGKAIGILVGFRSPDRPGEAVLQLVTTSPRWRRRGLGRLLVEAFAETAGSAGATTMVAIVWPGNPGGVRFLAKVGFRAMDGEGTSRLYGTPSIANYDGEGEDRAVFVRELGGST